MDSSEFQKIVLDELSKIQSQLRKLNTIEDTLNALKGQFDVHEAKDGNRHIEIVTEIGNQQIKNGHFYNRRSHC